jgi:SPP1 family predicted phage head-tail adaptor
MISGKLDKRITLQSLNVSYNDYNEPVESYVTLETVWAQVIGRTGKEIYQAQAFEAEEILTFIIYYRTDINTKSRIVYNSTNYDIVAPPREIGRKQGLEIVARAFVE